MKKHFISVALFVVLFGICWRDAISAYGDDNYDYPPPDCPMAPSVKNDFYID